MRTLQALLLVAFFASAACEDDAPRQSANSDGTVADSGAPKDAGPKQDATMPDGAVAAPTEWRPPSAPMGPVTEENFCDWFTYAACSTSSRCTKRDTCATHIYADRHRAACLSGMAAAKAGRVRFDLERGANCISKVLNLACSPAVAYPWDRTSPGLPQMGKSQYEDCGDMFIGQVELGGACYHESSYGSDECAQGYCRYDAMQCPGTCTLPRALNESCSAVDRCDENVAYCKAGTCTARGDAGATCVAGESCLPGLECFGGRCSVRKREGQTCDLILAPCEAPLACSGGYCKTKVLEGQVCQQDEHCYAPLLCRPNPTQHLCAHPGKPGEPCEITDDCTSGLLCIGRMCVEPPPDNSCDVGAGCMKGQLCAQGRCVNHPATTVGEPCAALYEEACPSGSFCSRATWTCEPSRQLGESCLGKSVADLEDVCVPGAYCSCTAPECAEDVIGRGTCVEVKPNGVPCDSGRVEGSYAPDYASCASRICRRACSGSVCEKLCVAPDQEPSVQGCTGVP